MQFMFMFKVLINIAPGKSYSNIFLGDNTVTQRNEIKTKDSRGKTCLIIETISIFNNLYIKMVQI